MNQAFIACITASQRLRQELGFGHIFEALGIA